MKIESVTVYCSSSSYLDPAYTREAVAVARAISGTGRELVYGGGKLGLMGAVSQAWREAGGRTVGVITERLRDAEQMDTDNDEMLIVQTMRERKRIMEDRGDAFVVLPGGLGTLEELMEILVGRIVGEHDKPLILVNTPSPIDGRGFYEPLLTLFAHMVREKFAKPGAVGLVHVAHDAEQVVEILESAQRGEHAAVTDRAALMPGLPGGHES